MAKQEIEKIETDVDLIKLVEDRFDASQKIKKKYQRQWYLNLCFFAGQHYVKWNEITNRIEIKKVPSWRVRLVANYIFSFVRKLIGKWLKNKPILIAVPATNEDSDKKSAKFAEKYLEFIDRKLGMPTKRQWLLLWNAVCGKAFKKIYWDEKAGDLIKEGQKDEEGNPVLDEEGKPVEDKFHLGEVACDILSAYEVFPDPVCQYNIDEGDWIIHAKVRKIKEVKAKYPDKADEVKADKEVDSSLIFDSNIMSFSSDLGSSVSVKIKPLKESVVVKECWQFPTEEYPKGRLIVVAGGVLLKNDVFPYQDNDGNVFHPFVEYDYILVPGRYWPMSLIEQLIPLQKEINKTKSQIVENKNRTSRPKYFVPKSAFLSEDALTDAPGEIVEYSGNQPPISDTPPSMPAYVFQHLTDVLMDMQNISDIHDVSRGKTPAGVKSGVAIAALQEQDDTNLGPDIYRFEEAEAKSGRKILMLAQQFYTEPRTLKIVGENNAIEYQEFKKSDITCNDVIVQVGSALPQSKVAKQQMILSLWESKLITDPRKILKLLELGNVEEVWEDMEIDSNQAQLENKQMEEGMQIEANWYDNHSVHLYEHQKVMKSLGNKKLPPEVKVQMERHCMQHIELLKPQGQPAGGMPVAGQMGGV